MEQQRKKPSIIRVFVSVFLAALLITASLSPGIWTPNSPEQPLSTVIVKPIAGNYIWTGVWMKSAFPDQARIVHYGWPGIIFQSQELSWDIATNTLQIANSAAHTPNTSVSAYQAVGFRKDTIEAQAELLEAGEALFIAPNEMVIGQRQTVEVWLATNNNVAAMQTLAYLSIAPTETISITTSVGTDMSVALSSDGFKIRAITKERQVATKKGFNKWKWEVTPTEEGEKILNLVISVIFISLNNTEESKPYGFSDKSVFVKANLTQRIATFAQSPLQWALFVVI
jgi:hypothetical protein